MERSTGTKRPWRLLAWLVFVGAVAVIGYISRALGSEPPEDVLYRYATAAGLVIQSALFLGILLLITIGLPKQELFGLRRPHRWGRAGGLAAACLGLILFLSFALSPVLDAGEEQGLLPEEWDSDRVVPYAVVGISIATIGPLVEELMFRGVGFALLEPYGKWVAIVGTGVLFGALHGLVIALPVLAAFGILLGWLRWKTGSVYPCVLLHGVFNTIGVLTVPLAA